MSLVTRAACVVVTVLFAAPAAYTQASSSLEGMWSDPPNTPEDAFCGGWCLDPGLERLTALLDDPSNDSRPVNQLINEARNYERNVYFPSTLTAAAAKTYPLDPATDPSFTKCEAYGLTRQLAAPHQLEIKRFPDRIEMRYGEWDAKRIIYMDGRALPTRPTLSRLGTSVGRFEGDTLVIESVGVIAHRFTGGQLQLTDELRVVERYTRSADGERLLLTATFSDPLTFKEPLSIKKVWRWAPTSEIAPYTGCEIPTDFRTREVVQ